MRYKVGDKVRFTSNPYENSNFTQELKVVNADRILTIGKIKDSHFFSKEFGDKWWFVESQIEKIIEQEIVVPNNKNRLQNLDL